jgi:hypothetical protein
MRLLAEMETKRRNSGLNPPVSSEKGGKNSVLICEQLSSVLLEVQSRVEIAGTVVAERQHVLASIVGATRDVGHPFRHRFGFRDLTTAIAGLNFRECRNRELCAAPSRH